MSRDFLAIGVKEEISKVLQHNGITAMTPVQQKAIPAVMAGKDVIVKAQTGTGKTLAFLLPILQNIKPQKPCVQALVITPTRELALQITAVAQQLAEAVGVKVLTIYGGQGVTRQQKKMEQTPQLVIATPGRLLDHLRRKTLSLNGVTQLVLDEADQLLHMGFLDEVEEILGQIPQSHQTMFFSATIPSKIRALSVNYMKKPQDISITSQNVTLDEIKQLVIEIPEEEKLDKLCSLINEYQPYLAMVFCHTKQRVVALNAALAQRGYMVDELHGDLTQAKRTLVMRRFKQAKLQILVATDIAARGLDIEGVTHVFNYDIPHDAETYIHRIGRTGRAGETGMAITLMNSRQQGYLRLIEQGIEAVLERQRASGKISRAEPKGKKTVTPSASAKTAKKPAADPRERFAKKNKTHSGLNQRSRRKPKTKSAVGPKKTARR